MVRAGHRFIFNLAADQLRQEDHIGDFVMKTLITVLSLSIVTATPMLALAAARHSVKASDQHLTSTPRIYWDVAHYG